MRLAYRIADGRHPVLDGTGARLRGGRWNAPGESVIYAAETFSGALLEVLVHANLTEPPKHHRVVMISIPDDLPIETVTTAAMPGWNDADLGATRNFGSRWFREGRTAVLRVPSAVTVGREFNLMLNTNHVDFSRIKASPPEAIAWDQRFFRRP